MKQYKSLIGRQDGNRFIYDCSTMELEETSVISLTGCDFSGFIYLNEKYTKSQKYDLYVRMKKHRYFSETAEYEVIYNGNYYDIECGFMRTIAVNGVDTGVISNIDCIAIFNGDLVIKTFNEIAKLEDYKGIPVESPKDFIYVEDVDFHWQSDVISAKESLGVIDNKISVDGHLITFEESYDYLLKHQFDGIEFRDYDLPLDCIKVFNHLFGDFKILCVSSSFYKDDLYFEYMRADNGGSIFPFEEDGITKGFYYYNGKKVLLVNIYDLFKKMIGENVIVVELPDGRIALYYCARICVVDGKGVFDYCSNKIVDKGKCDKKVSQLKREYLLRN